MPTLCQARASCRAFPASAPLVVQENTDLTGQDRRAHPSREKTEARRGAGSACCRCPAWRQLAKASGSKQKQGICPQLPGALGGALEIDASSLPFSEKAEGSVTLGRLPTTSEPEPVSGTHEGPGDPSLRENTQAGKAL